MRVYWLIPIAAALVLGCQKEEADTEPVATVEREAAAAPEPAGEPERTETAPAPVRVDAYAPVVLTADLAHLSAEQLRMVTLLIEAADLMNGLFWDQAYGDSESLLSSLGDEGARRFAEINYGPWDRLAANQPFLDGVGPKPPGANFYPRDMTKEEFEAADIPDKESLYTLVRRDDTGSLVTLPYHQAYSEPLEQVAAKLVAAADLAEDPDFAAYLRSRAKALTTDDYRPSDLLWMDAKNNAVDIVIGAIETYEDQLFGYKAAYEGYVLIKDQAWSERLARFADLLPELQRNLPVADAYKTETPGTDSDLNAYDVVYYAGDCNAGSKTIAINLPNDEQVQLTKGTRRLQLKNAMRAKFDEILLPIADTLIAPEQREHVKFDAFFANTMFHEVAHGLGIKQVLNSEQTVRAALKDAASALEEGKADILGLYMITQLREREQIEEGELMDNYVTFLASIFRSVRFGAASAHGRANMIRFSFFNERGAFSRDDAGRYRVNPDRMQTAMNELAQTILTIQGDGDYAAATALLAERGVVEASLQSDLDRLSEAGIPVDVVFEQGVEVLGL